MPKIRKAIFPVAGLGTRFLPATKASPKEMMPVVDKPLIQYAVEEAVAAGVRDIIFVTGRSKRSIEDHFDTAQELEQVLQARGEKEILRQIQEIVPPAVNCIYLRQPRPLGLGHAVLCAAPIIGDEPCAVLLADDLIDATPPALAQMCALHEEHHCSVLAVERIPRAWSRRYGMVATGEGSPLPVHSIVEKPEPEKAPSDLAVVGRYILTPRIFALLANLRPGAGEEIQLTDGIAALLKEEKILACPYQGVRYDCGQKLGYLQATVAYGLRHPEVGGPFATFLQSLHF